MPPNAFEAMPPLPDTSKGKKPETKKKERHLKVVPNLEEIPDLTEHAVEENDAAVEEARKTLEAIPDMTDEAKLEDSAADERHFNEAIAMRANSEAGDHEARSNDSEMLAAVKPKKSIWNPVKGWFS